MATTPSGTPVTAAQINVSVLGLSEKIDKLVEGNQHTTQELKDKMTEFAAMIDNLIAKTSAMQLTIQNAPVTNAKKATNTVTSGAAATDGVAASATPAEPQKNINAWFFEVFTKNAMDMITTPTTPITDSSLYVVYWTRASEPVKASVMASLDTAIKKKKETVLPNTQTYFTMLAKAVYEFNKTLDKNFGERVRSVRTQLQHAAGQTATVQSLAVDTLPVAADPLSVSAASISDGIDAL